MEVKLLSKTQKAGNEDIAGVSEKAYWVIDGATGYYKNFLDNDKSDAFWYVREINQYLSAHIDNTELSIKDILKDAVGYVSEKYFSLVEKNKLTVTPEQYPSATIALARANACNMEIYVLCDCTAVVDTNSHVTIYNDSRIRSLETETIQKIALCRKRDPKCTIEEARSLLRNVFITNRTMKNTKGGYYTLEFDKTAIDEGVTASIPLCELNGVLLMSDGFSRAVDTFRICSGYGDLYLTAQGHGLEHIWKQIVKRENSDPDCRQYPRTKKSDDSTAILIENR